MTEVKSQEKTCVVIGASHAGSLLAVQLRKEGWEGRIILIGAELPLPYHRPPLSKAVLAGEKEIEKVLLRPEQMYINSQVELRLGEQVTAINRNSKEVHLSNGDSVSYDKLALCTGAIPRHLPIGEDLQGVHYLRDANDVANIRKEMHEGKRALIIGGGYIGLETAAVMAKKGLHVTVAEMSTRLLQRVASPVISDYFRRLHESHGVEILTEAQVESITSAEQGLAVQFADGVSRAADIVVIGVGVVPETGLAELAGIDVADGIVVDSYMRTSDPDIVAAGDCTVFPSPRYGRLLRLESVQNALDQARIAATTLCAGAVVYDALPWFWSDQYDVKLQTAGLRLDHESEIVRGDPTDLESSSYSVFYMRGDRMIAADCVNRAKEFMTCKRLIAERLPVNLKALADESLGVDQFAKA
ncbi:MAG: NAD(P)/FAD-dependent oxidoreductase [Gammaproteobacteria bacterium]